MEWLVGLFLNGLLCAFFYFWGEKNGIMKGKVMEADAEHKRQRIEKKNVPTF